MIKGLTIIGIVIVVIGIVVFATGTYVNSIQSSNVQQCQLLTGELGQFLDSEVSEVCRTAPLSITMALIAVIAGIVTIVVGGVLSRVGALRKSRTQISPTKTPSRSWFSYKFGRTKTTWRHRRKRKSVSIDQLRNSISCR
jgi:hypothetical protein